MNYQELQDFYKNVAGPRMKEILEKTEIPDGLRCIDSLEIQFLDGRSCGVDYRIMAEGLECKDGQVRKFFYDEVDVSVGEFSHFFRDSLLICDGNLEVFDEIWETQLSTKIWNLDRSIQFFAQLEPLNGLKKVEDYLPYLKMQALMQEQMALEAQRPLGIVLDEAMGKAGGVEERREGGEKGL